MIPIFHDSVTMSGGTTRYWGVQNATINNTQEGTTADTVGAWRLYFPATTTIDKWAFSYFVRGTNTPSNESIPIYIIEGDDAGGRATTTLGNVQINVAPGNYKTTTGTTSATIEAGHWIRVGFVTPAMGTSPSASGGIQITLQEQVSTSTSGGCGFDETQFNSLLAQNMEQVTIGIGFLTLGMFLFGILYYFRKPDSK